MDSVSYTHLLINKNNDLQEALPSADRVIEILDVPLEQDYYGEKEEELKTEIKDIKFENLSFHYDDSDVYKRQLLIDKSRCFMV